MLSFQVILTPLRDLVDFLAGRSRRVELGRKADRLSSLLLQQIHFWPLTRNSSARVRLKFWRHFDRLLKELRAVNAELKKLNNRWWWRVN